MRDSANMQSVSVLIPIALPGPYDYAVPDGLTLVRGDFVRVPLGPRQVNGVVWGPSAGDVAPAKLKSVLARHDVPALRDPLMQFVDWVSPNKKCSIEMINDVTPDPIHQIKLEKAFKTSPIEIGTRIVILNSSSVGNNEPCSYLLSEDNGPNLGTTVRKLVNEWTHSVESIYEDDPETGEAIVTGYQLKRRTDREITLVSTTNTLGSSYRILPDLILSYPILSDLIL